MTRVVLPNPAGADTTVSRAPVPTRPTSRGRGTASGRRPGIRTLAASTGLTTPAIPPIRRRPESSPNHDPTVVERDDLAFTGSEQF